MRVARREFLGSAVLLATAGRASAAADENLDYRDGVLRWPGGLARAAGGRAGVSANKKEGDGATPAGTFALVSAFFRADRMSPPRSGLPLRALLPSDAWVDDPVDPNYNRLVSLPYPGHTEPLWLDDPVYDLLVVIGYNMAPVVPGSGSAIFLHIARPDFSPTAGCVAVEREVLVGLMPLLGPASAIAIRM
ncbi:MAG TPA: L,D-transpeptidase family protein [Stellaceae bacterium]|jgi:L,D-peptidoglycan transpeptidase YkuD (ErfK/YbiS/YcfS/YnhG family)|nr:L,D-transpeptidase family protein [Stellaceae bacterium]